MLLGFGLDAYVCVGVKDNGAAYTWVLLSYTDGTVYFIDSVLGIRFENFLKKLLIFCKNLFFVSNFNLFFRYSHHIVNPNDPPITKQPENKYNFKSIGFYSQINPPISS